MKKSVLLFAFAFLVSGANAAADGCMNLSGKYLDESDNSTTTVIQDGCLTLSIKDNGGESPANIRWNLDGKEVPFTFNSDAEPQTPTEELPFALSMTIIPTADEFGFKGKLKVTVSVEGQVVNQAEGLLEMTLDADKNLVTKQTNPGDDGQPVTETKTFKRVPSCVDLSGTYVDERGETTTITQSGCETLRIVEGGTNPVDATLKLDGTEQDFAPVSQPATEDLPFAVKGTVKPTIDDLELKAVLTVYAVVDTEKTQVGEGLIQFSLDAEKNLVLSQKVQYILGGDSSNTAETATLKRVVQ